jgi:tryptophan synthase alpha chain
MSRITPTFVALAAAKRKALIPYIVAGDPDKALTVPLMHGLVAAGADVIELGIPFTDPSSDGTVIQLGAERALKQGTTLSDILTMVAKFREQDQKTPIVLMGYVNPIEIMGYEAFAVRAAEVGVDGVLVVDLPAYESEELFAQVRPRDIDTIFLVAPTTTEAREEMICNSCTGYLYYVSLKGVTGAAISDHGEIKARIEHLQGITELPVVVGFGIKDVISASAMASVSDGVIVGSALVEKISQLKAGQDYSDAEIAATVSLIASMRESLNKIK